MPDYRGRIIQENWLASVEWSVETTTDGSQTNEVQRVGYSDTTEITGGTFTLTFGGFTTGALDHNASAGTVQTALEGLISVGSGNVSVSKLADSSLFKNGN